MSIKLILGIIAVLTICIFVFKKTVSGDAENDYRLRDILANAKDEEENSEKEEASKLTLNIKSSYNEKALEENIYEKMEKEQNSSVKVIEKPQEKSEEKPSFNKYSTQTHDTSNYNSEVYYEKINDDACETNSYEDIDEEENNIDNESKDNRIYKEVSYDDYIPNKSKSILDYIKTFWRGITFTAGLLFSLYAIFGLTQMVQTSNDAIVYSIWLLAGVILLK